jgi:nucleoside-diphosphate-sugar epimerase
LKCEEYMNKIDDKSAFPFICLRLPDVLGPFDDSHRFWAYMLWIKYFPDHPIEMVQGLYSINYKEEEDVLHKMSFVFSYDVADFIISIFQKIGTDKLPKNVLNQSYNVGFEEPINLPSLLARIVFSSLFFIIF